MRPTQATPRLCASAVAWSALARIPLPTAETETSTNEALPRHRDDRAESKSVHSHGGGSSRLRLRKEGVVSHWEKGTCQLVPQISDFGIANHGRMRGAVADITTTNTNDKIVMTPTSPRYERGMQRGQ